MYYNHIFHHLVFFLSRTGDFSKLVCRAMTANIFHTNVNFGQNHRNRIVVQRARRIHSAALRVQLPLTQCKSAYITISINLHRGATLRKQCQRITCIWRILLHPMPLLLQTFQLCECFKQTALYWRRINTHFHADVKAWLNLN